jgi:hypothetical protein
MLPQFLLPETVAQRDGVGAIIAIKNDGKPLAFNLGITRIIEQESLEVSIWGSADRHHWRQIAIFPQKFYCGSYSLVVDLARHPEVRFLRAQWNMSRWRDASPLFGFYVYAEEVKVQHAGAA